ncbi:MAG: hypothetical protein ACHQX1_00535 [Candidatus Micrarchaeales archaeon]
MTFSVRNWLHQARTGREEYRALVREGISEANPQVKDVGKIAEALIMLREGSGISCRVWSEKDAAEARELGRQTGDILFGNDIITKK